ncbi:MAG: hypothetical protein ACLFTT_01950 [Candidatus Hydrogenedentota bacterium]
MTFDSVQELVTFSFPDVHEKVLNILVGQEGAACPGCRFREESRAPARVYGRHPDEKK